MQRQSPHKQNWGELLSLPHYLPGYLRSVVSIRPVCRAAYGILKKYALNETIEL